MQKKRLQKTEPRNNVVIKSIPNRGKTVSFQERISLFSGNQRRESMQEGMTSQKIKRLDAKLPKEEIITKSHVKIIQMSQPKIENSKQIVIDEKSESKNKNKKDKSPLVLKYKTETSLSRKFTQIFCNPSRLPSRKNLLDRRKFIESAYIRRSSNQTLKKYIEQVNLDNFKFCLTQLSIPQKKINRHQEIERCYTAESTHRRIKLILQ